MNQAKLIKNFVANCRQLIKLRVSWIIALRRVQDAFKSPSGDAESLVSQHYDDLMETERIGMDTEIIRDRVLQTAAALSETSNKEIASVVGQIVLSIDCDEPSDDDFNRFAECFLDSQDQLINAKWGNAVDETTWVSIRKADSKKLLGSSWESVRKWKSFRWKNGETNRQALIHPEDYQKKWEQNRN